MLPKVDSWPAGEPAGRSAGPVRDVERAVMTRTHLRRPHALAALVVVRGSVLDVASLGASPG